MENLAETSKGRLYLAYASILVITLLGSVMWTCLSLSPAIGGSVVQDLFSISSTPRAVLSSIGYAVVAQLPLIAGLAATLAIFELRPFRRASKRHAYIITQGSFLISLILDTCLPFWVSTGAAAGVPAGQPMAAAGASNNTPYAILYDMLTILFGQNGWIVAAIMYWLVYYYFVLVAGFPFYYR